MKKLKDLLQVFVTAVFWVAGALILFLWAGFLAVGPIYWAMCVVAGLLITTGTAIGFMKSGSVAFITGVVVGAKLLSIFMPGMFVGTLSMTSQAIDGGIGLTFFLVALFASRRLAIAQAPRQSK